MQLPPLACAWACAVTCDRGNVRPGMVCVRARQPAFGHNHVLDMSSDFNWTDMSFSDDDRFIALSGSRGIVLVDAFTLREVRDARVSAQPRHAVLCCEIS
jgi:hypothetical protein